jgi:pyruvate kinase
MENFDEILSVSDGIMVARGDMGVEIEYTRLPGIQKQIIRKCYRAGKMVITATQMLDSMMNSPTPTRAEITDVANAVFDGTSAVMLSGETAAGKYPIAAVRAMARIAEQAEADLFQMKRAGEIRDQPYDTAEADVTNAICDAACRAARDLNARAVVALTKSGLTARNMSKFRPLQPIIAATPELKTFHQLALSWGVYPVIARYQSNYDSLLVHAVDCAKQIDALDAGDIAVIVAGVPLDTPGNTNLIKIETVS